MFRKKGKKRRGKRSGRLVMKVEECEMLKSRKINRKLVKSERVGVKR